MELLHGLVDGVVDYDDLVFFLYSLAIKSYLAEHWMNTLIKPVLVMMKLMGSAFGGLSKMHIGKKFPMNVRALCLVVFQLLCGLVDEIVDYDELVFFLYSLAIKSYLGEHWMNTLMKPVLIMLYVRAR